MKQTILAFGDSNTHGTPPMTSTDHHPRLARRWPVVMAEQLDCTLIEDGLPGRTACRIAPTSQEMHLDGPLGLRMALHMHGPIDHLLIMLGTNDLHTCYGQTPDQITASIATLLLDAFDPDIQARHESFGVTLLCPPPIKEIGTFVPEFLGGTAKSNALAPRFKALADAWHASFINAGDYIAVDDADGTHFNATAHETLGKAIAKVLASFE